MQTLTFIAVFAPLVAGLAVGLGGRWITPHLAHRLTILSVMASFLASLLLAKALFLDHLPTSNLTFYRWASFEGLHFQIGFLIDPLTVLMMLVVSFVSLMVHFYTIGYMKTDPGYRRFFCYIALFTFAMLMLVMANNLLQLFFGWEAVGLISYLLIGFWFKKPSAIKANLKAFLVNRLGDFGFLLGIAGVFYVFETLDYATLFAKIPEIVLLPNLPSFLGWQALTALPLLLFVGAMAKSAQIPLHVWLPDSMEGPTPISALIHAATMVTAGIFMVARLSPLFEQSQIALSFMLSIGTATCFLMGLLGLVQQDIKRVVAYSTLSQLGYMVAALGASAYTISLFHLLTHAFFKALLFLGAGAVIIALHHEQDLRQMGGLRKAMPLTYGTMLIGALALIGFPFFSGFYSKEAIIEVVHLSDLPGARLCYPFLLGGVFITALYTFRLFFLVFHAPAKEKRAPLALPKTMLAPLVVLAIASLSAGILLVNPLLTGLLDKTLTVLPEHTAMAAFLDHYPGAFAMGWHGFQAWPFYLAMAGVVSAWLAYVKFPALPCWARKKMAPLYMIWTHHYGFDALVNLFALLGRTVAWLFWRIGDRVLIDGLLVNGTAKSIQALAKISRRLQSGYIYHYAFAMITGFILLVLWLMLGK